MKSIDLDIWTPEQMDVSLSHFAVFPILRVSIADETEHQEVGK